MSTLSVPPTPISPRDDAVRLHKAFKKGFGCDSTTLVNILAHRDAMQRNLILQEYRALHSEDLLHRLSRELTSSKLLKALSLWMEDPAARDAVLVRQSLQTSGLLQYRAATEVICSRTPSQIQIFKQIYHSRFGCYLEYDLEQYTSGDHKKLLLAYISIQRYEGFEVDRMAAENDAKALYNAGRLGAGLGTDRFTFIRIFSERSRAHLAAVSAAYNSMYGQYGHSLEKVIKNDASTSYKSALLTILRCAENPARYFAKVLSKAVNGMGDDAVLTRVIVTRTEIDMQYIKFEYEREFKRSLVDAVYSDTYGHYRTFLLALLGH